MSVQLEAEDYAVYREILLQKFNNSRRERFVIGANLKASSLRLRGDETISSHVLHWRLKLKGLEASTADDFVAKNSQSSCLDQRLELPLPYTLLTEAESAEMWNRPDRQFLRGQPMDGWKIFRERYPGAGGVIRFSRTGFDTQKCQALLEVGVQADWLMGHGEMVLLSRKETGWKITGELPLWIS